jgi:hypothetical protein
MYVVSSHCLKVVALSYQRVSPALMYKHITKMLTVTVKVAYATLLLYDLYESYHMFTQASQ